MTRHLLLLLACALALVAWGCGRDEAEPGVPFEFVEPAPDVAPPAAPAPPPPPSPRTCETDLRTIEPDEIVFEELQPNLYILLDTSGSMGEWTNCQDSEETGCCDRCQTQTCCFERCCDRRERPFPIDEAKSALDVVVEDLAGVMRLGLGSFPSPTSLNLPSCGMTHLVPVGSHPAQELQRAYANLVPEGSTPTGASLRIINEDRALFDASDDQDALRSRAIVLITDGEPTFCEESHPSEDEAAALAEQGIRTFVVSFRSSAEEATLNEIATAGGTNNPNDPTRQFFVADDTDELRQALLDISATLVGCTHVVDPLPSGRRELRVRTVHGELDTTDFTYDAMTGAVQFDLRVCESLRAANDEAQVELVFECIDPE